MRASATSAALLTDAVVADPVFRFAETSQLATSLDKVDAALCEILVKFEVDHFTLYQATDRGGRPTGVRMAGVSHPNWRQHYTDYGLHERDDLLSHGLVTAAPTTWSKFRSEHDLSDEQLLVYDHAGSFGLRDGFYLPIHQPDGSMHGVSMMIPRRLEADPRVLAALHMLALYYSIAANRLGVTPPPPHTPGAARLLTPRQCACLQWVRAGKTSWEIGEIMSLSEHTVNEHLGEARKRLRVHTTTQAVIEAALLGLIKL